jgi:hypothetical protein
MFTNQLYRSELYEEMKIWLRHVFFIVKGFKLYATEREPDEFI